MWNPFKKKGPPSGATPNSVDALANSLQREGRIQELERELQKLDKTKLTEAEHESWWHIYGIEAFRDGRDQEATARFEEGHKRFPASAQIRFSLGQQYVRARQLDRGFELFRSCVFPAIPREFVLAQARYAYLWNRYEDGRLMLRPFLKAYKELKVLDDHFLYVRGLPFFGTWWSYLAAFSILENDPEELEEVTEYVAKNCHDYDFEYLKAELVAYRDDRPELMLPFLTKRLSETPGTFPTGFTHMKVAVIRGRAATNQGEAEELLNNVSLTDKDFRWLGDIRTLAKAEIAHRFGHPDIEKQHIDEFLVRQAMLFEPDIALNFHLMRYQERLKPRFQST